jgi:hypothetical protein
MAGNEYQILVALAQSRDGQSPQRNGSKPNQGANHGCFMKIQIAIPEALIAQNRIHAFAAVLVFSVAACQAADTPSAP